MSRPTGLIPKRPDHTVELAKLSCAQTSRPNFTIHELPTPTRGHRNAKEIEYWYREKKLGEGNFGAVYVERCHRYNSTGNVRAKAEGSQRAVKVMSKRRNPKYLSELEALAYFSHQKHEEYFVKLFGWFEDETEVSIAMEYFPLGDLQRHLNEPLPEDQVQLVVAQILEALSFMHAGDFAHRDLKPTNILIQEAGPSWQIKIADFGASKRADPEVTALHSVAGTPAFAAPEVMDIGQYALADGSYTNAVDLWSVGVITFLMLTGIVYFKERRRLKSYAEGQTSFPREELAAMKVSTEGCDLIQRLMSVDPEKRQTADQALAHSWLAKYNHSILAAQEPLLSLEPQASMSDESIYHPSGNWSSSETSRHNEAPVEEGIYPPSTDPIAASKHVRNDRSADVESDYSPSRPFGGVVRTDTPAGLGSEYSPPRASAVNTPPRDSAVNTPPRAQTTNQTPPQPFPPTHGVTPIGSNVSRHSWTVNNGRISPTPFKLPGTRESGLTYVAELKFSPNGKMVMSRTSDQKVTIWDVSTGKMIRVFNSTITTRAGGRHCTSAAAFSQNSSAIVLKSFESEYMMFDIATGDETANTRLSDSGGPARTLFAFSPDGSQIATSKESSPNVMLWDASSGRVLREFVRPGGTTFSGLMFSPDGNNIVTADNKALRLWDTARGDQLWERGCSGARIYNVGFLWARSAVASIWSGGSRKRFVVKLCDAATGTELDRADLDLHRGKFQKGVEMADLSPDGRLVVAAYRGGDVVLWDLTAPGSMGGPARRFTA